MAGDFVVVAGWMAVTTGDGVSCFGAAAVSSNAHRRSGDLTPLLVAGYRKAESYMDKNSKEETLFVEGSQLKRAHRGWVKCRS